MLVRLAICALLAISLKDGVSEEWLSSNTDWVSVIIHGKILVESFVSSVLPKMQCLSQMISLILIKLGGCEL